MCPGREESAGCLNSPNLKQIKGVLFYKGYARSLGWAIREDEKQDEASSTRFGDYADVLGWNCSQHDLTRPGSANLRRENVGPLGSVRQDRIVQAV